MITEPRKIANMFADMVCIWGLGSPLSETLNHDQRESLAQTIDRRLEEMIGGGLQLPPVISTGFLYVMDATGQRHTLTMDMAHSLKVCSCVRYDMIFILHLLKFSAIYRRSQSFILPRTA
jgi:hypothetical protein